MDFANLVFTAETSGLVQARTEMGRVTTEAVKTEAAVDRLTTTVAEVSEEARKAALAEREYANALVLMQDASRKATASTLDQINALTGVARSSASASDSTRDWVDQLRRQDAAFDDLRSSLDPIYASTRRYEAAVEQVNAAVAAGIVTQKEAARVVDLAGKRYLGAATGAEALGVAQGRASGMAGGFASQMQNASYQVGDFAVQIAGGGSAVTALAQQLPQLLGGFGLLGAAMGALVAIGGATYKLFFDTGDGADDLADKVGTLTGALDAYTDRSRYALSSTEALRSEFGEFGEVIRQTAQFAADAALGQAQAAMFDGAKEMSAALSGVISGMDALSAAQKNLKAQADAGIFRGDELARRNADLADTEARITATAAAIGLLPPQARALNDALDEWTNAKGPAAIRDASLDALAVLQGMVATGDELSPEMQALAIKLQDVAQSAAASALAQEQVKKGVIDTTTATQALAAASYAIVPSVENLADKYGSLAGTVREVLEAQNALAGADFRASLGKIADQIEQLKGSSAAFGDTLRIVATTSFDQQAASLAQMAGGIADMNGGMAGMDAETRAVVQSLLEAAQRAAGMSDAAAEAASNIDSGSRAAGGLSGALGQAVGTAAQLVAILGQVPGAIASIAGQVDAAVGAMQRQNASLNYQVEQGLSAGVANLKALRDEAVNEALNRGFSLDDAAAAGAVIGERITQAEALSAANDRMTTSLQEQAKALAGGGGGGGGAGGSSGGVAGAAKEADKALEALRGEAEAWTDRTATPIERYRKELAALDALLNAKGSELSPETYRRAVEQLNGELLNSQPIIGEVSDAFGNFVSSGLRDMDSLLDSFKGMIKQMIATAVANPIKLALGMSTGGAAMAAAPGAPGIPGMGGAGGALGGILGGVGGLMGGISNGFGAVISGFMSNGLSGAGAVINSAVTGISGASTAIGGLGAAIGAVAAPLAAVALVFAAFKSKTKLLDSGIRVTVDGMDSMIETFKKVEKSRFFGISKSKSKKYSDADAALADPISGAITQILTGIGDGVSALGLDSKKLGNVAYDFEVSTKGKSDAEIQAAIEEQLGAVSDIAIRAVAGTALDRFQGAEERLADTLNRMVGNLTGVNDVLDQLQAKAMASSVAGAAAATAMAEAAGGLQGLASAASTFMAEFWTEGERMASATSRVSDALAAIGVAMPKTRAEFRAIVDAIDTTTVSGAELYGQMLSLSGSFAAVVPTLGLLTPALDSLRTDLISQVDGMIGKITEIQTEETRAARDWKAAAGRIRGFVADMKSTVGPGRTGTQARASLEAEYQTLLARAMAGDIEAVAQVTQVADRLVGLAGDQAKTQLEAAAVQGRIMGDLSGIGVLASVEAERHAILAAILGDQAVILTEVRDVLMRGDELTAGAVAALQDKVNGVGITLAAADKASLAVLKSYATTGLHGLAAMKEIGLTGRIQIASLAGLRAMAEKLPGGLAGALNGVFADEFGGISVGFDGLKGTIHADLSNIGHGLGKLRAGLQDSADRVVAAINRQMIEGNLQSALTDAVASRDANIAGAESVIGAIRSLEATTGGVLQNKSSQGAAITAGAGGIVTDMAWLAGNSSAMEAFRQKFWNAGGLEDQLMDAGGAIKRDTATINKLRGQIAALGGIPAFERGGDHEGGARIVGERGPEIEVTGPARYMSAAKTRELLGNKNDNAELVSEVRGMRSEMRQLGKEQAKNTRATAKVLQEWNRIGQPETRDLTV